MNPKPPGKAILIFFAVTPVSRTNPTMIVSSLTLMKELYLHRFYSSLSLQSMTANILGHLSSHMTHLLVYSERKRRIWDCSVCVFNPMLQLSFLMLGQSYEVLSWFLPSRRIAITLFLMFLMKMFLCVYRRSGLQEGYKICL